jgi:hypothetical protein
MFADATLTVCRGFGGILRDVTAGLRRGSGQFVTIEDDAEHLASAPLNQRVQGSSP